MEIHRHPALTKMWAPVGEQPQVPAPGKNEKVTVYGGVNYRTGKLTYTLAATKCGAAFLLFLMALVKAYAGKKIHLVCDNGRFHHTQAVLYHSLPELIAAFRQGVRSMTGNREKMGFMFDHDDLHLKPRRRKAA